MSDKKDNAGAVAIVTGVMVAAMIAEAIKGLATNEALQGLVTAEQMQGKLVGFATEEQVKEMLATQKDTLIDYIDAVPPVAGPQGPQGEIGEVAQPPLDPDWLAGLKFKGADMQTKVVEGRKTLVSTPFERDLTPEDVLAWRVGEDAVTLIAADGKKHVVEI